MTLALGIDPGTATTGYGLVRLAPDGSLLAVKYGVITTPKNTPAPERLVMLYDQMQDLLRGHKPDTTAVEKLFFQRNVTTAISVGQARGVAPGADRVGCLAGHGGSGGEPHRPVEPCRGPAPLLPMVVLRQAVGRDHPW